MNPLVIALLSILSISAGGSVVVMNVPIVSQPIGDTEGMNWYSHQLGGSGGALTSTDDPVTAIVLNNCYNSTVIYTC